MPILQSGSFSFTIEPGDLAKGLRPSKRVPRNSKFLTECKGAVGRDGVLATIDDLELDRVSDALLAGVAFPYPQIFALKNLIIVATRSKIFEYLAGTLTLGIDITGNEGIPWSILDAYDYIWMSNTHISVRRRPSDKVWEVAADLPTASAICDYNGQIVIGSPDVAQ